VVALQGSDGSFMPHFPVHTGERIIAPVLPMPFAEDRGKGATCAPPRLVVPSFDGRVYLIRPDTGCSDWVDIGEQTYSMILADDMDGNGMMDLVVTTMNGNAFALATQTPYHPLLSWSAQNQCGRNGFAWRYEHHGVYALPSSRKMHDVMGATFAVRFRIVDRRKNVRARRYSVQLTVCGEAYVFSKTYTKPGEYVVTMPSPRSRKYSTVSLKLVNEAGQLFCDSFSLGFNVHFASSLQWLVSIPSIVCAAMVLGMGGTKELQLS